jgi:O2-independent ubiquinone biosynthesis accessory factor UbiT
MTKQQNPYVIPSFLSKPLTFLPKKLSSKGVAFFLNMMLKQPIKNGELDFLREKTLKIKISDINIVFFLTYKNYKIIPSYHKEHDIVISGNLYEFLLLLSRKEDPDTLFFNRRLKMTGDTELGLNVKNFLDSVEFSDFKYGKYLDVILQKSTTNYPRIFDMINSLPKYATKYKTL